MAVNIPIQDAKYQNYKRLLAQPGRKFLNSWGDLPWELWGGEPNLDNKNDAEQVFNLTCNRDIAINSWDTEDNGILAASRQNDNSEPRFPAACCCYAAGTGRDGWNMELGKSSRLAEAEKPRWSPRDWWHGWVQLWCAKARRSECCNWYQFRTERCPSLPARLAQSRMSNVECGIRFWNIPHIPPTNLWNKP